MRLPFALVPLAIAALSPAVAAQVIVVPPGADLVAAVASAPSGAILEIQSDGTYVGSLAWSDRMLTIRAGAGFSPTIQGDPGAYAVSLGNALPPTIGRFEGLRIVGDAGSFSSSGTGSASPGSRATFRDCDLIGRISLSGTGTHTFVGLLERCTLEGTLSLSGTGDLVGGVVATDCNLRDRVTVGGTGDASWGLLVRRSRIANGISVSGISGTSANVLVESSVVHDAGSGTRGIYANPQGSGLAVLRFVNVTVTGFPVGIEATDASASFENMLLHQNAVDVGGATGAFQVASSLIPDGTFAGVNGNFQATAILDGEHAPLAGSPALDSGNGAAVGLGTLDLRGDPRVQDGDLDGVARVNVGAVETPSCAPAVAATETVRLGVPANPSVLLFGQTTGPVTGRVWDPLVDHATFVPGAAFDYLAVSASSLNVPLAGSGTLLVDPARLAASELSSASTPFAIAIPGDCSVVGATAHAQAASFDPLGGFQLTNALDLVVGVF